MEHPGPAPPSQENSCIFSFDHQLLPTATTRTASPVLSQPFYGHNSFFPPRSSPMFAHCPSDSLLARNGPVSPYRLSHFASMQQPPSMTWMTHTQPTHVSPFSLHNQQLSSRSEPVLQPAPVGTPGPSGIAPQKSVCNFSDQLFQAHLSNMQLMQQYQGDLTSNNQHLPPNVMIRHPGPAVGSQHLWSTQQPPSSVPQPMYTYNGEHQLHRQSTPSSQMFILRPVTKPIRHSPYQTHQTCDNLIALSPQTERHVHHPVEQNYSTLNQVIRPIPIYSSQPPPGFECPSSLQFESNNHLQTLTVKKAPEVETKQINDKEDSVKEDLEVQKQKDVKEENNIVVNTAMSTNLRPGKKRTGNMNIDSDVELQLEEEFQNKRTPSQAEITEMAEKHSIGKSVIRSWFSSRRQKQKKLDKVATTSRAKKKCISSTNHTDISSSDSKLIIPSQTHDITIEVPSINPKDRGSIIHKDYVMKKTAK